MIKNSATIYINGINLTAFVVQPLKWGNLLDERLDEMFLSLRHCPFENFKPLTPVEIHFSNALVFGSTTIDTQTDVKRYIVADDQNATENPNGSGLYNHDLYVIELTKLLECIAVDTNTITNSMGRVFTDNAKQIIPEQGTLDLDIYVPQTPSTYVSPILAGQSFEFVKCSSIFPYIAGEYDANIYTFTQEVYLNNDLLWSNTFVWDVTGNTGQDIGYTTTLQEGTYKVKYSFNLNGTPALATKIANYTFLCVANQYPFKRWTITDVINRLCDIAEPIRQGETPRFQLNADQASLYDNVLAPQISFTKSTFRECLQQCGKIVHGEPRLDVLTNSDGSFSYEISYDQYGGTELSNISGKPYISKTVSQTIESYASQLDSSTDNIVNQLDKYAGVITDPYAGGYKTVRTETLYVRITDANMLIATQYPINSIEKVECVILGSNSTFKENNDITPYVFESSIYNTQLSSYSSDYPYSKAYGLCYTQGQRNITGLNFKQEDPISDVFKNYAIINILSAVTNQSVTDLTQNLDYALLAFRVTYTPFYNSRVGQTKVNYGDYPYAAALIYNQQANIVEASYYGENLKGTIARIGNMEKSITYNLARLSDIPKAGMLYDEDYYISAVSVEFLPTYIKCTIGLSKDFNRLSQYIGISSVKRFYEVSQGQAQERNTLWKEYIVVGDQITADTDCYTGSYMLDQIANAFDQSDGASAGFAPITNVVAWGTTYGGSELPAVTLPVISSAFGNSIAFSWTYEDNYSAGAVASYQSGGTGGQQTDGYFQDNYQYTDYYGRMYFYNFDLQQHATLPTTITQQTAIGLALPGSDAATANSLFVSTIGNNPIVLRKDNREALQCNFQIDFVSNRKGLIIGSALAAYCSAVRPPNSDLRAKLYVLQEPVSKFINHVTGELNIDLSTLTGQEVSTSSVQNNTFSVLLSAGTTFQSSGVSWVICTTPDPQTQTVQDEEGNVVTQTIQYGGDVLLAQNMQITAGDTFPAVYFALKRDVFDRSCWVANK